MYKNSHSLTKFVFIIATVQLRMQAFLLLKCNLTQGTLSLSTEDSPLKLPQLSTKFKRLVHKKLSRRM